MSFDTDAELDVNNIRMSQLPKYLGHTSFYGMHKLSEHMDTHTESIALAGPLKWTVVVFQSHSTHWPRKRATWPNSNNSSSQVVE